MESFIRWITINTEILFIIVSVKHFLFIIKVEFFNHSTEIFKIIFLLFLYYFIHFIKLLRRHDIVSHRFQLINFNRRLQHLL